LDLAYGTIVEEFYRQDVPEILYHYTNWTAFEAIVRSGRFRATAHHCTNDPGEFISADDASRSAARRVLSNTPPESSMLLRHFLTDFDQKKLSTMRASYLTCFSLARDDPEQWKTYGAGGAGVCIGVRTLPEESLDDATFARSLVKVKYDAAEQERALADSYRRVLRLYATFVARHPPLEEDARRWGWNALFRLAGHAAMSTKTAAWSREQEWRQVAFVQPGATVTPIHWNGPSPTHEHVLLEVRADGQPIALAEVILGSNQDPDRGRERARQILESAGYGKTTTIVLPAISISTG
jgi:hypothetical protein